MSDSIATQLNCQKCGAALPVEIDAQFVTCEFCTTTNFVDKSRVVLHYAVRATLRQDAALAALRRWMAGNATVKDLDKKAQIGQPEFQYFPMWMVRASQKEKERVLFKPAAALSVSELEHISVPAADLELFDPTMSTMAISPTVPYETMRQWLADNQGVDNESVRQVSLVHLPIYICKYEFGGRRYTAIVDAATSKVFANIYPSKWQVPYLAIGALAFAAYFCAALVPMCGYMTNGGGGLAMGLLLYLLIAVVLAVPIFLAAMFVSAKV